MNTKKYSINDRLGYIFILPNVLIYTLFIFIPLVWSFVLSFTDYNLFQMSWVGFENYRKIFQDDEFVISIWNTFRFSIGRIVPSMIIGLLFAMLLNGQYAGKAAFRTILFLPNVISVVAGALAWSYILDSSIYGIANRLIMAFGGSPREWLMDIRWAMPSVIIMSTWIIIGFNMLVYLAGLQSIPYLLYEAATIDGASRVRQFFSITIPMLRPTTFFLFVMACISSFQVFGQVYIMTSGGPLNSTTTIVHQIYQNGFQGYKMGFASSQAVFLLLVFMVITLINFKTGNRGEAADVN